MLPLISILLIFLLNSRESHPFNIDIKHPLIISNLADGPESHFGAKVSLLASQNPPNEPSWIIIGAPKANSTRPKLKNTFEPGIVYRCSLGKEDDVCHAVIMDSDDELVRRRINITNKQEYAIAGSRVTSWLGGSFASSPQGSGSHFVSCAPRWSNVKYDFPFMNGICYWRSREDLLEESLPPIQPDNYLIPLSQRNDSINNNPVNNIFPYTFGQSGFSLHIPNKEELILGAPGIYNWSGSVVRYSGGDDDKIFDQISVLKANEIFQIDSLFGYSVTSGNYFEGNPTKTQYVAGAPRGGNLLGKILVFNFPEETNGSPLVIQEIHGAQVGSYFGSALCTVDLNNDGWDDLLVGAPHHTAERLAKLTLVNSQNNSGTPNQIFGEYPGFSGSGDEGAVFIFMSTGISFDLMDKKVLYGLKSFSAFGSEIASIGDINKDGFGDIAVGAPNEGDGRGAIYIYLGNPHGVRSIPSQVITASSIDRKLRGFGYSISGGVDIDHNGYNDLAVGSFGSASAVLLRTRPTKLSLLGRINSNQLNLPLNISRFEVESCVSYQGVGLAPQIYLEIELSIDVESKMPRVLFQKKNQDVQTPNEFYEEIVDIGLETCTKFIAIVAKPLETFFGKAVVIQQKITMMEPEFPRVTNYNMLRSLNGADQVVTSGFGFRNFCSDCPMLDPEVSYTRRLSLPLALNCGADDVCQSDLRLTISFENIPLETGFMVGSANTITMHIRMENMVEIALTPGIEVTWFRRNLLRIPPSCQTNALNHTYSALQCTFGKTLEVGQSVELDLEFDMKDLLAGSQGADREILFSVEASTASSMVNGPVVKNVILPLRYAVDMGIEASSIQTIPFNPETNTSFQEFTHTYRFQHYGDSPVSNVWLEFAIPANLTEGDLERVVIETFNPDAHLNGKPINCTVIEGSVKSSNDPRGDAAFYQEGLFENNEEGDPIEVRRKKRGIYSSKVKRTRSGTKIYKKGSVFLDCSSDFIKCVKVKCHIEDYPKNGRGAVSFTLHISSEESKKLLNSYGAKKIQISSFGKVSMPTIDPNSQMSENKPDEVEGITIFKVEATKVANWIIIVSVVGGLLAVFTIICLCYALGCFERKKKDKPTPKNGEEGELGEEMVPLNKGNMEERKLKKEDHIEEVDEDQEDDMEEKEEGDEEMSEKEKLKSLETPM